MVTIKKKVTLRTKTSTIPTEEVSNPKVTLKQKQPRTEDSPPSTTELPTGPSGGGKGKWIAAALAGLIVIGGGGYYLSQQSNDVISSAQFAKIDVNGDGVINAKDDPTEDTNGDGVIDFNDAAIDTNEDGVVNAEDAAVADSNGDGVIDSKDKSSDEMLKEKNVAQDNVDNPTTDNNDNASGVSSNTGENGKVASNTGNNINDASEASSTTSGNNNRPGATSTAQGSKTGNTIMNANNQKQIEVSTNQTSPGTKSSNATTSNSERQITPKSNKLITLDENPNLSLSIKELAKRAIRGDYGNNPDRKRILGKSYKKVQREVNRIYRQRHYRR